MTINQQIKKYLKVKPNVFINYNNEAGIWLYSVQVVDTDFWLDSFKTQNEAFEYCERHNLEIIK